MKKTTVKLLSLVSVFTLIVSFMTPSIAGAQQAINQEKKITELAEALEFIAEEGTIYDQNGQIAGFDLVKFEKEYGYIPEEIEIMNSNLEGLNNLNNKPDNIITPMNSDNVNQCVRDEIASSYGVIISGEIVGTIIEAWRASNYTKVASEIIKAGAKGSVFGIAATVYGTLFYCLATEGSNPW